MQLPLTATWKTAALRALPELALCPPVPERCPICGQDQFKQLHILWPELISAWGLTKIETDFINRQQGIFCCGCESNLRSMALAGAVNEFFDWSGTLNQLAANVQTSGTKILEINAAGQLHPYLQKCRNYEFAAFPELDLQHICRPDDTYDLVIHADTLEHVLDPIQGLRECLRILKPRGCMLMSIPIVPSKLTRRRHNLPPCYHNTAATQDDEMRVWTEYGADFYLDLFNAGWKKVFLFTLGMPEAMVIVGNK